MYSNDLFALPLEAGIIGYADETSLLYRGKTREGFGFFFSDITLLQPWFKKITTSKL